MIHITVEQDGTRLSDIECRSVCLSFDDGEYIKAVVSSDANVSTSTLSRLGCVAGSACLKSIQAMEKNLDMDKEYEKNVDIEDIEQPSIRTYSLVEKVS